MDIFTSIKHKLNFGLKRQMFEVPNHSLLLKKEKHKFNED